MTFIHIVMSATYVYCVVFDGIKPQVHGLIELVIKEYRSDMELFNSINLNLWLEEKSCKLGFSKVERE